MSIPIFESSIELSNNQEYLWRAEIEWLELRIHTTIIDDKKETKETLALQ